jgi:hypothetical protein
MISTPKGPIVAPIAKKLAAGIRVTAGPAIFLIALAILLDLLDSVGGRQTEGIPLFRYCILVAGTAVTCGAIFGLVRSLGSTTVRRLFLSILVFYPAGVAIGVLGHDVRLQPFSKFEWVFSLVVSAILGPVFATYAHAKGFRW